MSSVNLIISPASANHLSEFSVQSTYRCDMRRSGGTQSGVGLIEVMVAVLVLSIGFLGMAALQVTSLSTNNSAMARSMATIDSYSILDAMRSDSAVAEAGTYNFTDAAPLAANNCPASSSTLASVQINTWCQQLGSTLGSSATGAINCSNTGICKVTIIFDDSRASVGGTANQTITAEAML